METRKDESDGSITLPNNDPSWQLLQWKLFIEELIAEYGPRSILSTDAGANNVSLVVEKRP